MGNKMSDVNLNEESGLKNSKEIINDEIEPKILSTNNIKSYLVVLGVLFGIVTIYYLLYSIIAGSTAGGLPIPPPPGSFTLSTFSTSISFSFNQPSYGGGINNNMWPLWGQFTAPTIFNIIMCVLVFLIFTLSVIYFYRKRKMNPPLILITIVGIILIIGTNLIQGWVIGIEMPIGGTTEILTDAMKIENMFSFIMNYEELQFMLSVHAQTQPPGAVLIIYLLYLVFRMPGLIAIALCSIATITSVYFINGIFKRIIDEKLSNYTIFLFLLLPAIQVYFLANIYAIVASLIFGIVYFYSHSNRKIRIIGSICCLFLLSFVTFLFVYIIIFLFLFELIKARRDGLFTKSRFREHGIFKWLNNLMNRGQTLLIMATSLVLIYGGLLLIGFNYINAFLYASSSTSGFTLFSNPLNYFVTRIQNVLDVLIFFGPILIVLCYSGIKNLKEDSQREAKISNTYLLVISAIFALLILFVSGAPNKGETARICMFILPFLLIPVAYNLQKEKYSQIERVKLLMIVFGQTLLFQLIATWVW